MSIAVIYVDNVVVLRVMPSACFDPSAMESAITREN